MSRPSAGVSRALRRLMLVALATPVMTAAQVEGGVYIAGNGFSLEQAATRGLAQNPGGQRFFLLVLPPHTRALALTAPEPEVALRNRILAGNGQLLVCQRDIDSGAIDPSNLALGVITVRGWPPPGSNELPDGQRYFANEDPVNLPQSNESLRRVRATCS